MSGWDSATADWYASKYGDDPSVFAVVAEARIEPGAEVLDIGCGTGSALRALLAVTDRLTGVDPTPRMIELARASSEDTPIAYHVAPAEALGLPDQSQDVVLAINAVHHWQDEAQGLRDAFRVLRPGGRIVIGGERFGPSTVPGGQDYEARLVTAGFGQVETQSIPDGFVTIARKPG